MAKGLFKPIQQFLSGRKKASPYERLELSRRVIHQALALGASAAGIADLSKLRCSPSHQAIAGVRWPPDAAAVVVLALEHAPQTPMTDWWDQRPGSTPGNRRLIAIGQSMVRWLRKEHAIAARSVAYQITKGGIFVKDAAVLAGMGVLGRNNLLVTPSFGPMVRLRAILLTTALTPSPPLTDFAPCTNCPTPCRPICPRKAFQSGAYDRRLCQQQMDLDEATALPAPDNGNLHIIRYCRACELSCIWNRDADNR
jgi:epoxyqueuosine reductase